MLRLARLYIAAELDLRMGKAETIFLSLDK